MRSLEHRSNEDDGKEILRILKIIIGTKKLVIFAFFSFSFGSYHNAYNFYAFTLNNQPLGNTIILTM